MIPEDLPITWILTRRDRALSVRRQRTAMATLGIVRTVIEMDTCHDAMISQPKELADILLQRCLLYGASDH